MPKPDKELILSCDSVKLDTMKVVTEGYNFLFVCNNGGDEYGTQTEIFILRKNIHKLIEFLQDN